MKWTPADEAELKRLNLKDVVRKARKQDEFRLQCAVADLLAKYEGRLVYFHVPNGERRNAITGARLKRMGAKRGVSDFVVLGNNRVEFWELKAAKGQLSKEQKAFSRAVASHGFTVHVIRSLDDAKERIQEMVK